VKTKRLVAPEPWRRRMIKMDAVVQKKIDSRFGNAGDKF
jgi:hypothetical protein